MTMMLYDQTPLPEDVVSEIAKDLYLYFIEAHLNCGENLEPRDYEPFADLLVMLTYLGYEKYEYDALSVLFYMLERMTSEKFVSKVEDIGCLKAMLLLFVAFSD